MELIAIWWIDGCWQPLKNEVMRTKLFLLISLVLLGFNLSFAQPSVIWKNKIEGNADQPWTDYMHPGKCIATDPNGNVVVVGRHSSQLDMDGSSNTYPISATGQAGGYVASYTNTGEVRWGVALNSVGWDEPMGVSIDPHYNVYVYGFFEDTIDLDPGPGIHEIWPIDGDRDLYIVKLDSSGNYIHSLQLETEYINPVSAYIYTIDFDSNMNIYIAGSYRGYFDADPGSGVFNLQNYSGINQDKGFIIKYDSTFQLLDGWSIASPNNFERFNILDFDLTSDDGFYITGEFVGDFDIDLLTSTSMENTNGKTFGYLGKYDSTGSLQWFEKIETQYYSRCHQVVVDSLDNATIMGNFGGIGTFYQSSGDSIVFDWTGGYWDSDYFILKYDASGNPVWGKHLDLLTGTAATSLTFNSADYVKDTDELWISFSFHSSINMDVGESNYIMSTSGWTGLQMSVLHYNNSSGALLGAYPFEFNTGSFQYNYFTVQGNELSMWGDMPINPDIDLDLGPGTDILTTTTGGMYIVRYCVENVEVNLSSDTLVGCVGDTLVIVPYGADKYTWFYDFGGSNTLSFDDTLYFVIDSTTNIYVQGTIGSCRSSIETIYIEENQSIKDTLNYMICFGDSLLIDTQYYSLAGTYTDTILNTAGCDSVLTTLNLTINSVDTSVTQSGNTLTSNASNAAYQWVDCDNGNTPIVGETASSFTSTNSGNFAVEVVQNGCIDTSDCYSITGTGILENSFEKLVVYPNPTSGLLTIELSNPSDNATVIQSTLTGQVVDSKNFTRSNKLDLEIIGATGIYLIDLKTDDGKTAKIKVIKQ